ALLTMRLNSGLLNKYIAERAQLDLRYDGDRQLVYDKVSGTTVGSAAASPVAGFSLPGISNKAWAAETPDDLSLLLDQLSAGDLHYRVEARARITKQGPVAFKPLIERMRMETRRSAIADILSIVISIIQQYPENRTTAVQLFLPSDFTRIVEMLGD